MGEMVAHGAGREDTAYRNGTRVSARDHSRLSGDQYGRILVAATVETEGRGCGSALWSVPRSSPHRGMCSGHLMKYNRRKSSESMTAEEFARRIEDQ